MANASGPTEQRQWLEELIFGSEASRRFTQDSPVLPDVWIHYGLAYFVLTDPTSSKPDPRQLDLLLTPHRQVTAAELGVQLAKRLETDAGWPPPPGARPHDVACNQSSVVARLYLEELVRVALPLSLWWREWLRDDAPAGRLDDLLANRRDLLREALDRAALKDGGAGAPVVVPPMPRWVKDKSKRKPSPRPPGPEAVPIELVWTIRVVGTLLLAREGADQGLSPVRTRDEFFALSARTADLVDRFAKLMQGISALPSRGTPTLWTVSRNRTVNSAVLRSVMAVKADAARRLFDVSCSGLSWAIIDSGIDATHPAFRKREARPLPPSGHLDGGAKDRPISRPFEPRKEKGRWENRTRVAETYDFTDVRALLSMGSPPGGSASAAPSDAARAKNLKQLKERLAGGQAVDWDALKELIRIPHRDAEPGDPKSGYRPPVHEHGTHVAGILAADWRSDEWDGFPDVEGDVKGVCPDINLFDLRVIRPDGGGDEFSVMAALQFVRHLNAHREQPAIHGVNLSLSVRHDVANYACGRTPVCDESERVVASGVVVVAAAGNDGYVKLVTPTGDTEGYRSISISDPGNAEGVITVGATHRYQPHTYGVSYFSSRGPTGDGRIKPDLVAPGEKIDAPVPGGRLSTKDGTSMAAPHVSGAAALLMARHRELLGQPQRVKKILCSTATDLGRERYFQGSGMVDILRAMQSV